MKRWMLFLFLCIPFLAQAQVLRLKSYVCSNGYKIHKGDSLLLGIGTAANGDYQCLVAYPQTLANNYFPGDLHVKKLAVKRIYKNLLNQKVMVFLMLEKKKIYACDIEKALKDKEILAPYSFYNFKLDPYLPAITYKGEINTQTANSEIVKKADEWFRAGVNDSLSRIVKEDISTGVFESVNVFIFHSNINSGSGNTKGYIQYTTKIRIIDGVCHYEFADFVHIASRYNQDPVSFGKLTIDGECPDDKTHNGYGTKWSQSVWDELKQVAANKAETLVDGLKKSLSAN